MGDLHDPLACLGDFGDAFRVPPHNLRAEQSLIGGLMLDPSAWDRVADVVTAADFYRREHRCMFSAIADLAEQGMPRDVVTIADTLRRLGTIDDAGGIDYLVAIANETPSAANANTYAQLVRKASVLRQMIQACAEITDKAYQPQGAEPDAIVADAAAQIGAIAEQGQKGTGPQPIKAALKRCVEHIDRLYEAGDSLTGLPTGLVDLDASMSGLQPGDLIVIAGRPSMGKTTLAQNIADRVAMAGHRTLFFSLEMPELQLTQRSLASDGRVRLGSLRSPSHLTDDEWPRLTSATSRLSGAAMLIDDTSTLTTLDIATRARRAHREEPLKLIVVDYLQLISSHGRSDNRTVEVGRMTRDLKLLAKSLSVPVIVLSQLNRGLASRSDKRPVMSDLRESGSIEQDADVILLLYRDEVYNEDSADKGTAEVIIAKQRNGPTGTVRLAFAGEFVRFDNLSPEWQRQEQTGHRDSGPWEY